MPCLYMTARDTTPTDTAQLHNYHTGQHYTQTNRYITPQEHAVQIQKQACVEYWMRD